MKKAYEKLKSLYFVGDISVSYTLKSDDITNGAKPQGTPYLSRKGIFDENFINAETNSRLSVSEKFGGFVVELKKVGSGNGGAENADDLSEFGLNLPLKFMGKKNCGGWKKQYLFNSPYNSSDNRQIFCYLTNPEGKNLLILSLGKADGWKMDYSLFSGGQFFDNLKFLASFDKAYKSFGEGNMSFGKAYKSFGEENKAFGKACKASENRRLKLLFLPVSSYEEAIEKVSEIKKLPVAYYEQSYVKLGEKLKIYVCGDFDYVRAGNEKFKNLGGYAEVEPKREGLLSVIPRNGKKKGLDAVIYAYKSINELFRKSMYSVSEEDLATGDGNLCEWKCHVSAILRYMRKFGKDRTLTKKIKGALDLITERDESKAKDRQTIFYKARKGYPAYNVFNSNRVQEQFFGIGILLDAYKVFGTKKYLDYAVKAMESVLKHHLSKSGAIETFMEWSKKTEDYTTVCCLIIPVIELAEFLKDKTPEKSEKYYSAARGMAKHVYERGISFPTETLEQSESEPFIEEGSMSCSALTLLYFCEKVERKEEYIVRAKEILDIHDSWVIKAHKAPMFFSSLRWWETKWEGDKDGNALCCGHAWTIWRAEADYRYYALTGDKTYLEKARNGFMSNLSKIDRKGRSYACYQPDYITGGGFTDNSSEVEFRIVNGFPKQTDSGLSRYVWSRLSSCEGLFDEETDRK